MNPYLSALGTVYLNLVVFVCMGQKTCLPTSYPGRVSLNTINGKGLEGVVIRINNLGSERTRTGSNGNFQYKLSDCPGTRMRVEVTKNGYSVVNQIETFGHVLTRLADSDPSQLQFPVIMCLDKETDTYRLNYYSQIASFTFDNETINLRDRINQLEKRLTQNGKEKDKMIDSLATLKVRYQETTNAFSQQQQQVQQIAKLFANLSTADIDTTYQKAFDLYQKGKLDEAQELLSSQQLDEEQKVYRKEKQMSEQLAQSAERKKRFWITKAQLKGTLYESQFDFANASVWYEKAVLEDSTQFDPILSFADFLFRQNRVQQSERWYNLALKIVNTDEEKSIVYNRLGILLTDKQRYIEAETAYLQSWTLTQKRADLTPEVRERQFAMHLMDLSVLYSYYKPLVVTDSIFQRTLAVYEKITKSNTKHYEYELAQLFINIGGFYTNNNIYPVKAEIAFQRALTFYEEAIYLDKETEGKLAITLFDLGNLYGKNSICQLEAELYYRRSLKVYKKLANNNFERFGAGLASAFTNLGVLYQNNNRIIEADSVYRQAFIIKEKLSKINPEQFEGELPNILYAIGSIYNLKHDKIKAEEFYNRAIVIQEKLYNSRLTNKSAILFGDLLNDIGIIYKNEGRFLEADSLYKRAIILYENLHEVDSIRYESSLFNALSNLGKLYTIQQRLKEAEAAYQRALYIREKMAKLDPDKYEPSLAWRLCDLGEIYNKYHDTYRAEHLYLRALQIYEKWGDANPEKFDLDLSKIFRNVVEFYDINNRVQSRDSLINKFYLNYMNKLYKGKAFWHTATSSLSSYSKIINDSTTRISQMNQLLQIYDQWQQKRPLAIDSSNISKAFGGLAWNYLLFRQFIESETIARKGISLDYTQIWINTNIAPALLFQGKLLEAKAIYKWLKDEKDEAGNSFKPALLNDLAELEKAGIYNQNVSEIRKLLK